MRASQVFAGGHVFDGRTHLPGHGLVVADGRVLAVVPEQDLRSYVGAGTEVVDLAGGLVQPGFQDAHVHPVQAGVESLRCDLSALERAEDFLAAVGSYAAGHPDRQGAAGHAWVLGGGWSMPAFGTAGPQAADLDALLGDRPVFLANRDHHSAWVSGEALRRAGVDASTPDPVDGRIERAADGTPSGTLHEGAMDLVQRVVPPTSAAELDAGLVVAQARLHELGVTSWQDAILGAYAGNADPAAAYLRAVDDATLTARVRGALWWERDRGTEQVEELVARREAFSRGRLVAGSVKIMQDGIVENWTAGMSVPYRDGGGCAGHGSCHGSDSGSGSGRGSGLSFLEPEALAEAVTRLDAAGFQVHVHAIGDRAVRETLDAFERARSVNGPSTGRHHVAHVQVVAPADRRRFAELDVTANIQALWAVADAAMTEMTWPFLDPELASWQYPFGSLAAAGVRLAAGSDWPVSSPDPLAAIHVAVNRVEVGAETEPLLPAEALTPVQAFAAYTSGSAWVNHLDDTGLLAPGLLADLAVLDRDPLAGDPAAIGETRVVSTWVEGAVVARC